MSANSTAVRNVLSLLSPYIDACVFSETTVGESRGGEDRAVAHSSAVESRAKSEGNPVTVIVAFSLWSESHELNPGKSNVNLVCREQRTGLGMGG